MNKIQKKAVSAIRVLSSEAIDQGKQRSSRTSPRMRNHRIYPVFQIP